MINRLQLLTLFAVSIILSGAAVAQSGSVSGSVLDAATGETLPGANIFIVELGRGAATNADGEYTVTGVSPGTYTFRITYVGYQELNEQVQVGSAAVQRDFNLTADLLGLEDVVVTALGMQRSERSLGYAVQEVTGDELAVSGEANLVNSIAGKTAGVLVNSSNGQPGGGSRIIIRGNASLQGNNQPLFIVDGIPISNDEDDNVYGNANSTPLFTGSASNRGLDIDASNIEEMSVLKGASATALYGSRAANGVIIITTKNGKLNQAPTVNIKSSITSADAFTDGYQTDYLGGIDGYYYNGLPLSRGGYVEPGAPSTNSQTTRSWGPHKDEVSSQVLSDLGVDRIETFDPRAEFYQTAMTYSNSVSIAGGTSGSTYYASVANTDQSGIVPGTELNRTSVMARFATALSDRVDVQTAVNYIDTYNKWLGEGNGAASYLYGLNFTPINFDPTQATWEDGTQRNYTTAFNNPNWLADNNGFYSEVDRFIANTSVNVRLVDWLELNEKIGIDTYSDKRDGQRNVGTIGTPDGSMYNQKINRTEINSDLTLGGQQALTEDITVDFLIGNNVNIRNYSSTEVFGNGLNAPGFFHISNANIVTANEDIEERRLIGLYGQATADYQNLVYLTLTARNDWSSTLPFDNNSYFYPSASVGFVFSDAFGINGNILSFGKLRASYSKIGNDAPVYSLATAYLQSNPGDGVRGNIIYPYNGVNGYRLSTVIGNSELKPETTSEYEVGVDLRFFQGRGSLDVSYYTRSTVDQIFQVPTSYATGYAAKLANAGEIKNYGLEVSAGATVIQSRSFRWDLNLNFAKNTTEVVEFAPGVENIFLGGFSSIQVRVEDTKNGYGVIWGSRYQRNDDGQLLIGDDGLPLIAGDLGAIGNVQPDWTANLRSTINFKSFTLSALLDKRQGGDILNFDQYYSVFYGTSDVTADRGSTYVFEGVNANTGQPNDVEITRDQAFYQGHYTNAFENLVEDGSFLKLREVSLSYSLPARVLANIPLKGFTITGTGRNLWIDSDFSYKDPEGSLLGTGNAQGFYHAVTPGSRSFSVSLNLQF